MTTTRTMPTVRAYVGMEFLVRAPSADELSRVQAELARLAGDQLGWSNVQVQVYPAHHTLGEDTLTSTPAPPDGCERAHAVIFMDVEIAESPLLSCIQDTVAEAMRPLVVGLNVGAGLRTWRERVG